MINIFDLYEKVCDEVNTHQGGHMRPNRNFINWVNDVQMSLFNEYIRDLGLSEQISGYLKPFKKSDVKLTAKGINGIDEAFIEQPSDYAAFDDAKAIVEYYVDANIEKTGCDRLMDEDDIAFAKEEIANTLVSCERVDSQRWGSMMSHLTKRPNKNNPKITEHNTGTKVGFKLAPKSFGGIMLSYYRHPKPAKFNYEIKNPGSMDEHMEFISQGSVHLEWSESLVNEFVNRIAKKYAKYTRESGVYQMSEMDRSKTG